MSEIVEHMVKKRLEIEELYKKASLEEMIDYAFEMTKYGIFP
jgi:hypothetical protein